MAWVNLALPTAELSLKDDGWLEWNAALQIQMGDPVWVDLMWDAANTQLGIRSARNADAIPVVGDPESLEFKVNAEDVLDLAGITPENVSQEPEASVESPAEGGLGWSGHGAIYYLTLP